MHEHSSVVFGTREPVEFTTVEQLYSQTELSAFQIKFSPHESDGSDGFDEPAKTHIELERLHSYPS